MRSHCCVKFFCAGGVFFDDLDELPQESLFAFASDLAASVIPAYMPLVNKRKKASYTQHQRDWQLLRRGVIAA